jgi:hypothetical protein
VGECKAEAKEEGKTTGTVKMRCSLSPDGTDTGGQGRLHWQLTGLARVRSCDLVIPSAHSLHFSHGRLAGAVIPPQSRA